MGQSHSQDQEGSREIPIEQLSHELALKFASKCYSHLEIAHFKDNFKTLSDHQDDVEYWKEETLCRFLSIPDVLYAGPVLYQMVTYLGAFPFPQMAPCIVTREAMLKVVTLLTGRFKKVLKRGEHDKNKLIFRSMAIFDRRASSALSPSREKQVKDIIKGQQSTESDESGFDSKELHSQASGYAIDEPLNDDEDEDDDDLALAALDSLDAIEVFKHDHRSERKINLAHIPCKNLHRLLTLLLALGSLAPQDNISILFGNLSDGRKQKLDQAADAIVAAFDPIQETDSITYSNFVRTVTMILPHIFRPLNPLFEHFLFSKQMDVNKHQSPVAHSNESGQTPRSPIYRQQPDSSTPVLDDIMLSQMSCSFGIATTSSPSASSFFHCGARLNVIYSTSSDGTSMSSFSRQINSWRTASLLIMSGTHQDSGETYVLGAYLPELWKDPSSNTREEDLPQSKAVMFQLRPRHAIFRANPSNRKTSVAYYSTRTGIALGCIIPSQSVLQSMSQTPVLGPVSLLIDEDISTATFQHDGLAGTGAFLTDPRLEESQASKTESNVQPSKIDIDIDGLEVWGISFPDGSGDDEVTKQQKRLAWEEEEAARRRGVNFGGDKDGARALLEMAGLVGDDAGNRTGGSV